MSELKNESEKMQIRKTAEICRAQWIQTENAFNWWMTWNFEWNETCRIDYLKSISKMVQKIINEEKKLKSDLRKRKEIKTWISKNK